jgi:arylsulfatase A-like enzyme
MNKLRESGLEENTLVFFMSDNGGKLKWGADNGVLRKGKGSALEGGWRVPFLMQWKGVTQPSVYDQPVNSLDVLATIADLSGAPLNPEKPLDGVNLIPYVTGAKQGSPHRAIFLRGGGSQGSYAVRMGDYKIITYNGGNGRQMFNLKNDISEENNIIKALPERFKEIDSVRAEWSKGLIEPAYLGLEHTNKFKENRKND